MVDPAGHKDSSDMEQTLNKSASCELKLFSIIHEGITTMPAAEGASLPGVQL